MGRVEQNKVQKNRWIEEYKRDRLKQEQAKRERNDRKREIIEEKQTNRVGKNTEKFDLKEGYSCNEKLAMKRHNVQQTVS